MARLATPDRANRRSRSASDDTTSEPSTPTGDASRPSFLSNVLGVGLSEGDVVVVVKEEMGEDGNTVRSSLYGQKAVVTQPNWNGMVKVEMLDGSEKGHTKSYKAEFLKPAKDGTGE
uniref:Uncharacterized protein n=1 Tax=Florenciella parvula TaxID=236787 RepID=A0A7S2FB87_9STRA